MTGRLRPWSAIDELQHKVMDDLYEHDERLALLPTGFGKTMVEMTVGEELRAAGVIKYPLVFAPLRVAQKTWPEERGEWEHLKDVPMVQWGGEPANWAPSLWRDSRILWGKRTTAENLLPGSELRAANKLKKKAEQTRYAEALKVGGYVAHILAYYEEIERCVNPNQLREAARAARVALEERLTTIVSEERAVNKAIRAARPAEAWHVTSFENIEWLTDLYPPGESPFDMWVVDETGRIARNPKSPRYKALKKHMPHARIRHGLNATPAPEGCEDLFGQVQIVCGAGLWGKSFYDWRQKFFVPADYMGYSFRLQLGAFDLLMADLNKVAFRVPAEALAYKKNITHRQITADLPEKARAAYDDMARRMAVEIEPGADVVAMSEATASQKLRQICQGYLYETDEATGRRIVHHLHDEKTEALAELVDSMEREPLLVCYQFDEDLENIRKIWKNVPFLGQGVSAAKASEHIDRWNKRELPVLAMHPLSASHGINLQYGGHNICWLALPWSLDSYSQSNDRIDRRGQEHQCYGHHIMMRGTIDERVSDALIEKHEAQQKIIAAIRRVA